MTVKILSYAERADGTLEVVTDYAPRPGFAYPADRFHSLEELQAEIERSISFEAARSTRNKSRLDFLKIDLDFEVEKNKPVVP